MRITPTDIRQQLMDLGLLPPQLAISDTESLMDAAVIDSLNLADFVVQLERTYGISVELNDLTPDSFDSIANIVRFVNGKINALERTGGSGIAT